MTPRTVDLLSGLAYLVLLGGTVAGVVALILAALRVI